MERFESFAESYSSLPPFHYGSPLSPTGTLNPNPECMSGSHYSNAGIVLFYLLRIEPFASLHLELQGGTFDCADRLFSSVRAVSELKP